MAIPPIVLVIYRMGTHHQLEEENAEGQVAQAEQEPDNGFTSTQREVVTGINETAKLFGVEGYKFEEKVELKEFNYSKYLHEVLLKDKQKAEALKDNIASLTGFGMGADLANVQWLDKNF